MIVKKKKEENTLTWDDYKFIQDFCKTYHIIEGRGHIRLLEVFLDEYNKNKKAKVKK